MHPGDASYRGCDSSFQLMDRGVRHAEAVAPGHKRLDSPYHFRDGGCLRGKEGNE